MALGVCSFKMVPARRLMAARGIFQGQPASKQLQWRRRQLSRRCTLAEIYCERVGFIPNAHCHTVSEVAIPPLDRAGSYAPQQACKSSTQGAPSFPIVKARHIYCQKYSCGTQYIIGGSRVSDRVEPPDRASRAPSGLGIRQFWVDKRIRWAPNPLLGVPLLASVGLEVGIDILGDQLQPFRGRRLSMGEGSAPLCLPESAYAGHVMLDSMACKFHASKARLITARPPALPSHPPNLMGRRCGALRLIAPTDFMLAWVKHESPEGLLLDVMQVFVGEWATYSHPRLR